MIIKTLGLLFLLRNRPPNPTGSSSWTAPQVQKQRLFVTTLATTTTPPSSVHQNNDKVKESSISATLAKEAIVQDLETSRTRAATNETLATTTRTTTAILADSALGNAVATLLSGTGFLVNTVLGLKRYPFQQLAQSFVLLLDLLAVVLDDGKFWKIFLNRRSLLNFLILSRVVQDGSEARRQGVTIDASSFLAPDDESSLRVFLSDSVHYMRYATAAYGTIQIAANEAGETRTKAVSRGDNDEQQRGQDLQVVKQKIANYVGVDWQDILYCSAPGGNTKIINHIVAIDRRRNELVWAIRGTYSVAGVNTDLDAQGVPWYGGKAHGGFAVRSQQLLENEETMQAIARGLALLEAVCGERGKLKLVGHSLGAGIACLLNVAIQSNTTLFQDMYSDLECYGYACPPAFTISGDDSNIQLYDNCKCYIHQQDTVPFLSVSAGQRLFETMIRVGDATKSFSLIKRVRMAVGWTKVPQNVQDTVKEGSNDLEPEDGRLNIPANDILWIRLDGNETEQYSYAFCNRTALSMLSVNTDFPAMLLDHFPPGYDKALTSINSSHVA